MYIFLLVISGALAKKHNVVQYPFSVANYLSLSRESKHKRIHMTHLRKGTTLRR